MSAYLEGIVILTGINIVLALGYWLTATRISSRSGAPASWHSGTRSRLGLESIAVREDELAASAAGLDIVRIKVATFGASAFITGVGGALLGHYLRYISPESFGVAQSVALIPFVVRGGLYTFWGPVVGATFLTLLPEFSEFVAGYYLVVYGGLLVVLMVVRPQGLVQPRRFRRQQRRRIPGLGGLLAAARRPPLEGSIVLEGREIARLAAHKRVPLGVVRTFQNIRLFGGLTVLENIAVGQHVVASGRKRGASHSKAQLAARADELVELLGLGDNRGRLATGLPYGIQKRLELARAMASEWRVLLLDEPTAGMDGPESHQIMSEILKLKSGGTTIVLVEHDMEVVMGASDLVTVLNFGQAHRSRHSQADPQRSRREGGLPWQLIEPRTHDRCSG